MLDEYAVTREFPGKLIPSDQSRLAFEIPGKINSINVDIGDEVILGDELASLDDREALAQLNQSKAKFDLAEQVLARYINLRADGHISIQDLDKAESDQIVAKSQYDFYRVKFEQTKLLAPFNGVIQNRFLDTGSVINAGVQVLEILGSSNVEARISIPMNYMNKVKIGDEYEFDIRGISTKATLERLAPMSTGGSNNRLAIFRFDTFFNPGSIVKLKLSITEKAKGTWVPIKSLSQSEQGIWAIYTINEQQVVVRDLVDVIYFEDEYAFVSGTLNNGDLVILGGAQKIIEGKIIK
jgi:RND family efflux transporter MFP subunit